MKKYFAITISDSTGSKHFSIKASTARNLVLTGIVAFFVVMGSFGTNMVQYETVAAITQEQSKFDEAFLKEQYRLNKEILRLDRLKVNLEKIITNYEVQVDLVSAELVNIERVNGIDTGDLAFPLQERIKRIGEFYNAKEEEYTVIGNRVEQIEGVIGLDEDDHDLEEMDLSSRVELASLTASQERILHDSIPNGFPLENKRITSKFGMRKHPVTKVNSFHKGVDLRAKTGAEIYATADGFVSHATYSDLSGNRVVIMHNFGFETRYSHLDSFAVEPGDVLHRGDLIGYSGNTGRSNAPHLHYEIRYLGQVTDPFEFLKWEFGTHEIFTQVRGIKWPSLINLINKQITHQTLRLSLLDLTSRER